MSPNVMQNRNRYFTWSAFIGLLVLLVSVGALGILAYSKLDAIVKTAASASKPDNDRLLVVREMVSDLYDAENHMMMYALSRDEAQLQAYETAKKATVQNLKALRQLPVADTASRRLNNALTMLIEEKFMLMRAQIDLREYHRTDQVLDELSRNLQKTLRTTPSPAPATSKVVTEKQPVTPEKPAAPALSPEAQKERANAFYRWMMGLPTNQQTATTKAVDTVHVQPSAKLPLPAETDKAPHRMVVLPATIERELAALTLVESDRYRENLERDLAITIQSQEVSGLIRAAVTQIDQMERKATALKSAEVATTARTANTLILIFCIVFPVLLLLITVGIVSYFRSMQRHEASIVKAKARADALANARARFLATMSHEIRTPMNAIIGFSNQLLKTSLEDGQREHLDLVHRAADHLLGIVNTVLDFSRLESEQMQYAKQDFSLASEIDLVLDLLRPQFKDKGLALKLNCAMVRPSYVRGDALRLRQILLNLLNNSLKFTERGAVTLTITHIGQADDQHMLRFAVSDTGMGIPAERLSAVFKAFEQSDATISHKFGGSGLGLAITKMLVEQQGGTIGIDSQVGQGTTIWFTMPFGAGSSPQARPTDAAEQSSLRGKMALIADDEPFNRRLLEEILATWGMKSVQVSDGRSAVQIAETHAFDIVLMDLRMPDMNGIDATSRLRRNGLNRQTPVIILTAATQPEEIASCLHVGVDCVLSKRSEERR